MKYSAMIFDLDETLIVENESVKAAFEEACAPAAATHGLDAAALSEALRRRGRELWFASPCHPWCRMIGISSWEGLAGDFSGDGEDLSALRAWMDRSRFRATAWAEALGEFGVEDDRLAGQLAAGLPDVRSKHHALYPETLGVLGALRERCRLGMLTNGAPRVQRDKIEAVGIERHFDAVIVSGEVGIGKPSTKVFEIALRRLGAPASESAMIGDSLRRDIAGANAAGIRSIWINRGGRPRDQDIRDEAEIATLNELLP